jgi:hypothetical protein
VNFVTAHDGFTLTDLVTYNDKHNEANGEDNKDGSSANHSWNCGAEGPTEDPEIDELRGRQTRNMLATLLLSRTRRWSLPETSSEEPRIAITTPTAGQRDQLARLGHFGQAQGACHSHAEADRVAVQVSDLATHGFP